MLLDFAYPPPPPPQPPRRQENSQQPISRAWEMLSPVVVTPSPTPSLWCSKGSPWTIQPSQGQKISLNLWKKNGQSQSPPLTELLPRGRTFWMIFSESLLTISACLWIKARHTSDSLRISCGSSSSAPGTYIGETHLWPGSHVWGPRGSVLVCSCHPLQYERWALDGVFQHIFKQSHAYPHTYIYIYICSRPWTPPPLPPPTPPPLWGWGGWWGGWVVNPPPPVGVGWVVGWWGGGVVGWWGGGVVGCWGGGVVGWWGGWVVGWLGGWGVVRSWLRLDGLV